MQRSLIFNARRRPVARPLGAIVWAAVAATMWAALQLVAHLLAGF